MVNLGVALPQLSAVPVLGRTIRQCTGAAVVATLLLATQLTAQIRGRPAGGGGPLRGPSPGWWFSGGAGAVVMGNVNDGASGSVWRFSQDPVWQLRGSLEKAIDEASTIGIAASYGKADLTTTPFAGRPVLDPLGAEPACYSGCEAQLELWSLMGQFRSGGGRGFHSFFEAQGGVTGFRNLREKSTGAQFGSKELQLDLAGTLGFGFGYTLADGFAIALVQDFGIGWHSTKDLPADASRTYRMRTTRATLRFKL